MYFKYLKEGWEQLPDKIKAFALFAFAAKILCLVALAHFVYFFSQRAFTDTERLLLFVAGISYFLNSWFVKEFRRYRESV